MKRTTKTVIYTAALTGAVALVVGRYGERLLRRFEKMFVRVEDVQSSLAEATEDELRGELTRRAAERSAMSGLHMGQTMGYLDW